MATIRGRAIKVGGVATEPAGFSTRTGGADDSVTRPAYQSAAGQIQPLSRLALGHPLLDLSQVGTWRLLAVAAAAAYVIGFHVSLGRTRVGIGPAR